MQHFVPFLVYRRGNILHVYLLIMSQVVVRVVEHAMERAPEIVMVAIVCQSLNPSHKQVHIKYVSPPIHVECTKEGCGSRDYTPIGGVVGGRGWEV